MSKLLMNKPFLELMGTHFLICNEKIAGSGEDSGYEAYLSDFGIMGVFDGCGGLGSMKCPGINNKTQAYVTSRVVGNTVRNWFRHTAEEEGEFDVGFLRKLIIAKLAKWQEKAGNEELRLKGSMIRPFPSTIAMIVFEPSDGELITRHVWAGDSRTFFLDQDGLAQISTDDIDGQDAMSNLIEDGVLKNMISADGNFVLHETTRALERPSIVLCATDGCFGYVPSPMEFEFMILSSLMKARNVDEWRKLLGSDVSRRSGDDQTIALAVFGFDTFAELQGHFASRYEFIRAIVKKFHESGEDEGWKLWESYKPGYYRYFADKREDYGD